MNESKEMKDFQRMIAESKEMKDFYRNEIRRMIDETDDAYTLRCAYTVIITNLEILAEKGGAA